ncbi:sulfurtransferase complex subunit TusB [Buchnera aphidicola]|uniref:Protein TusB n=1 Tax=Buchnera aphidicola (Cinara laricifoliae) TaxID=2518977 RepID=A0A451DBQ1_9GAMM|nr:sulfurtransferase complex subunit TusB [Buchnera aphidicola]VFP83831.1 Protein TusB [Buchnera aphidicola (Cinara laricifoliae)]
MLHILLNSPYNVSLSSLLSFSSIFDDLICIQDGVILGLINNYYFKKIHDSFNLVYFLEDDLSARGLLDIAKKNNLIVSNYQNFVYLTAGHDRNITW